MGDARAEVTIDRSPDDVWGIVGDFSDVDWIPGAEGCRVVDEHDRVVSLADMELTERLLRRDDRRRELTYTVVDGPLRLDRHEATITVTPDGSASRVTWEVTTDDDVVDALRGDYQRVLDSLKATLEAAASERRFVWVLRCPCGTALEGTTEDEIVDVSLGHLRDAHPDMADAYEREHVLFMAQRFVRT
jgi:Polyketide cyclase / dehydrase and lipid transport